MSWGIQKSKLKNILFIVDAGNNIGLGHYKRCLELTNKWHHGANSIFLTQSKEVLSLNKNIPTYSTSKEDSIEKKQSQVEKIVSRHDVDVIICDINNKDALDNKNKYIRFIEAISKLKTVLVSFEDFLIHDVCSDVVIIPYFGAEKIEIGTKKDKYLLGLKYFVARNEFLMYGKNKINQNVKNIFISMGGADTNRLTEKIINTISKISNKIHLNIVSGPFSDLDYDYIENTTSNSGLKFKIYESPENISEIMHSSDVGIVSSGLTQYEASIMGLPTIVISLNGYHQKIVNEFSKINSIISFGVFNDKREEALKEVLIKIMQGYDSRKDMSANGQNYLDGNGVKRIIEFINEKIEREIVV